MEIDISCIADYAYEIEVGLNEVSFDSCFNATSEESEYIADCGSFQNFVVKLEKKVLDGADKYDQLKLKVVTELVRIPACVSLDTDVIEQYDHLVSIAPKCCICKRKLLSALGDFSHDILCVSCQNENDTNHE